MADSKLPISREALDQVLDRFTIADVDHATIRQILAVADTIEREVGEPFIHLELGNPGLPANRVGIEAEIKALESGVANKYPNITGIPELKTNGSRFIKAFMDIDMPPRYIIPTVGSMQACFTTMLLMKQRLEGRDSILFLDPGFPAQHHQAFVLGIRQVSLDIYNCRGAALEAALEEAVADGRVTAMLYSTPNNPAWTNLTEEELQIIARVADRHDIVVLEDHAYIGMDFRRRYGRPGQAPFIPTVARYTDNYILLLSGSKIFSYAGQRIATVCISPAVYERKYQFYQDFYGVPAYGDAYVFGVLYVASSGVCHSAQYALAAMMGAAADGTLDFVDDCSAYGQRAARAKKIFLDAGFELLYSHDGDDQISDGFFFTLKYGQLSGSELQKELMRHGISTISLKSAGSLQQGVRVCVPLLVTDEDFDRLDRRARAFSVGIEGGAQATEVEGGAQATLRSDLCNGESRLRLEETLDESRLRQEKEVLTTP